VSASEPSTLAIGGTLTVDSSAARWRELRPQAAAAQVIDLAGVDAIDSAGLALVQALRQEACRAHGSLPRVQHVPARMQQLCIAHRVDLDGN
jgi:phospholipid transport system transporter-binding protein